MNCAYLTMTVTTSLSAQTAGPRAQHFAAIEEALPALRREFTPGTAVLVKASHAMEFGKIVIELEKM